MGTGADPKQRGIASFFGKATKTAEGALPVPKAARAEAKENKRGVAPGGKNSGGAEVCILPAGMCLPVI